MGVYFLQLKEEKKERKKKKNQFMGAILKNFAGQTASCL